MHEVRKLLMDQALLACYGEDYEELGECILARAKTGYFDTEFHYPCTLYWEGFCRKVWTHCVTNLGLGFQMSYGYYGKDKSSFDYITIRIWWS